MSALPMPDAGDVRFGVYLADLRRDRNDSQGIINYAVGLCRALAKAVGDGERLIVYANDQIAPEITEVAGNERVLIRIVPAPNGTASRLWMDHVRSVLWARRDGLALMHFPKGFLPIAPLGGTRFVVTAHDDIPLHYAKRTRASDSQMKRQYFAWLLRRSLRDAGSVVTDTQYAADRLQRFRPSGKTPVAVAGLGVESARPLELQCEKGTDLVHFGSRLPHKRSRFAIDATVGYLEDHNTPGRLIVTGCLDPELQCRAETHPRVKRQGRLLSSQEVGCLLGSARALIFTSCMEGFGLPPVEAYLAGTPAVWARATSLPEVMADAPGGFRVDDPADFARALEEVLALSEEQIAEVGSRLAARFTWSATASRVLECYRELVGSRPTAV